MKDNAVLIAKVENKLFHEPDDIKDILLTVICDQHSGYDFKEACPK